MMILAKWEVVVDIADIVGVAGNNPVGCDSEEGIQETKKLGEA